MTNKWGAIVLKLAMLVIGLTLPSMAQYKLVNTKSGMCMDVNGSSTATGAKVQQWHCHGHPNQVWNLLPNGSIVSSNSGMCLDVNHTSTDQGAQVYQWTCNGHTSQLWNFLPNGNMVNRNSGLCLTPGGDPSIEGAGMIQLPCEQTKLSEVWTKEKVR